MRRNAVMVFNDGRFKTEVFFFKVRYFSSYVEFPVVASALKIVFNTSCDVTNLEKNTWLL